MVQDPGGCQCILRPILHEAIGPYREYISRNSRLVSMRLLRPNCDSEPDVRGIGLLICHNVTGWTEGCEDCLRVSAQERVNSSRTKVTRAIDSMSQIRRKKRARVNAAAFQPQAGGRDGPGPKSIVCVADSGKLVALSQCRGAADSAVHSQ